MVIINLLPWPNHTLLTQGSPRKMLRWRKLPQLLYPQGKRSVKNAKEIPIPHEESGDGSTKPRQQRKEDNEQTISVSSVKQGNVKVHPAMPVFKYILKSRLKDGESPFGKCTNPKSTTNIERKFDEARWHVLKEKGVLLVHKANPSKLTKALVPGFVSSSKGLL